MRVAVDRTAHGARRSGPPLEAGESTLDRPSDETVQGHPAVGTPPRATRRGSPHRDASAARAPHPAVRRPAHSTRHPGRSAADQRARRPHRGHQGRSGRRSRASSRPGHRAKRRQRASTRPARGRGRRTPGAAGPAPPRDGLPRIRLGDVQRHAVKPASGPAGRPLNLKPAKPSGSLLTSASSCASPLAHQGLLERNQRGDRRPGSHTSNAIQSPGASCPATDRSALITVAIVA